MAALGEEFGGTFDGNGGSPTLRVSMEGTPRELHPILRDDIYRIAREALRNAFRHSQASKIEADITYDSRLLRLRIRDDGKGIDPKLLDAGRDGHWGLPGMCERAEQIGAQLDIWSEVGAGTEVDLRVPGSVAYGTEGSGRCTTGNLGLTDQEENQIVAFLQTLTDGFTRPYPDRDKFTGMCMTCNAADPNCSPSRQGNGTLIPTPPLPPCASDICGVSPVPSKPIP